MGKKENKQTITNSQSKDFHLSEPVSPTEMIQRNITKAKKVNEFTKKTHFLTKECETFKKFIHTNNLIKRVFFYI